MSQREITVPCGSSIVVRCSHSNTTKKNKNATGVNNKKNKNAKMPNKEPNNKRNNNKLNYNKKAMNLPQPLKNPNAVGERPEPVAEPVKNNNAVNKQADPVAVAGQNVIEALGNNAPGGNAAPGKNPNAKGGKRTRKAKQRNHRN